MMTITQSTHNRLVRGVADDYIRKGYSVKIEPGVTEIPDFLQGFRPDLIVTTPDESIVVEVKSKGNTRPLDYWRQLEEKISSHPGWRFQLVIDNRREKEILSSQGPILSEEEVESRLRAGSDLADSGLLDSGLLVIWSAIEALLWEHGRKAGLDLANQGPAPLITTLFTDGDLERSEYDALMQILQKRNQAAHGFSVSDLNQETLDQALRIADRLLNRQQTPAEVL